MIQKILIVSDSHGRSGLVENIIRKECPDMLIHLGDIEDDPGVIRSCLDETAKTRNKSIPVPAVFVQGNCDRYAGKELKAAAIFNLNGHRFYCTHGHRNGVDYGVENLAYTALENGCDFALYGHTHRPFDDEWEGVRILNPGSIGYPRGGSKPGYMILQFDERGDYTVERKKL